MNADAQGRRSDLPAVAFHPHPTAAAVFEALNRANVRWCLLRGEARLDAPPHDVDLLVAREDVEVFASAVRRLGFVPVPTWARGSHQFFVAHHSTTPEWFLLDVVTELSYGPAFAIETGCAGECLGRRERVGPLSLLRADDAFWTLLLHCLLDRRSVPAHQQERLASLAPSAHADSSLARFVSDLCPLGWTADRIVATVSAEGAAALAHLAPVLVRRGAALRRVRFMRRRMADVVLWRLAPLHTLVAMYGLRVVLVDDSGDIAKPLARALPGAFYLPVVARDAKTRRSHGSRRRARTHVQTGLRRIRNRLFGAYHQARGRVVVIPLAGGIHSRSNARVAARAHLVITLAHAGSAADTPAAGAFARPRVAAYTVRPGDRDLRRARAFVLNAMWQAYARERGWAPTPLVERQGASVADPAAQSTR